LYHAGGPAHLALDAAEPPQARRLGFLAHDRYIPPGGIDRKRQKLVMTDPAHAHSHDQPADGVLDPVCGMTVDPHATPHRHSHHGRTYYFCSAGCRTKFAADPDKYLSPAERAAAPVAAGTIYTCPMHPQIRQASPGACPICGMALEPE